MDALGSISINDLIFGSNGKRICFVVPSYQRGYRWSDTQIKKLLTDLYEYDVKKAIGEYYCLQPIVVKEIEDQNILADKIGSGMPIEQGTEYYEIVDGQQRMTTVFILLKYLNIQDTYSILFERDKDRRYERYNLIHSFSRNFDTGTANPSFADAYYFVNALDSIKSWFAENKQKLKKSNLEAIMTNVLCDQTQVIWYPLEQTEDCYTVFKNLNHGKIPLTDAELVKAMLLNSKNFVSSASIANPEIIKQEQDRYARLWDEMQKTINDDRIWSFITGGGNADLPTNIDYIIQLVVKKEFQEDLEDSDHKFFSYFEEKLSEAEDKKAYVEDVFEKLRVTFRTIQDWHDNYRLHNYIGYRLTYTKNRIDEIIEWMKEYAKNSKSTFEKKLKDKIAAEFTNYKIDEINYEDNRKQVEKLLMLFNIEELNRIHEKFDFSVDKEGWSIEHIKAQHSEIAKPEDRKAYLENEKNSLQKLYNSTGDGKLQTKIGVFINKIDQLIASGIDENQFIALAADIDKDIDGFDDAEKHLLGNLALIWKSDNSGLSNDSFYSKCEKINGWSNDFKKNIPFSTQKAFQKMYSKQDYSLDPTRWKKTDFDSMFSKQKEMLGEYIQ